MRCRRWDRKQRRRSGSSELSALGPYLHESRDVLRAGLQGARWVSTDDTGARHQAKNGFCTQIGNEGFTWFGTRSSKSRLNFLDLLRAGHTDYVLNAAAYDYMRDRGLSAPSIPCSSPMRCFLISTWSRISASACACRA
jgi:hypothetical protein